VTLSNPGLRVNRKFHQDRPGGRRRLHNSAFIRQYIDFKKLFIGQKAFAPFGRSWPSGLVNSGPGRLGFIFSHICDFYYKHFVSLNISCILSKTSVFTKMAIKKHKYF